MSHPMKNYFRELTAKLFVQLKSQEILLVNYEAEESDFCRFNQNKIRQAGHVIQQTLRIELIYNNRECSAHFNLCGHLPNDMQQCKTALTQLRNQITHIPENPFIHFLTEPKDSCYEGENRLPELEEIIPSQMNYAQSLDLVGIWASGSITRGFANSIGQFNWHTDYNFNFDWSIHHQQDKAIKQNYAGSYWNLSEFQKKIDSARETLPLLSVKPKTIQPGKYRVFLTATALHEILELLSWGGFGLKSHRTSQTPLLKMVKDNTALNEKVSIYEEHRKGLTPHFTQQGFLTPESVSLIENGYYKNCLNNNRSAKEYGETVNCSIEHPQSLWMKPGSLAQEDILQTLDTGLYISNLWYCNYSDRNNCRITGMTRFACFWVENGVAVAPVNVMRFDESIYQMLGGNLIDLTKENEQILDPSSYEKRSEASATLPGALIDNFTFTL